MSASARPVTLLIAALGGEGGGVLSNWIVAAAEQLGFPVQSTSIPGVAQRTGATTYYIEILPVPRRELFGRRPVLSLVPGVGDIDVLVASELMEAARTVAGGFVTPERTLTIASTSRFYVIDEKIAMGDGRYDSGQLTRAIEQHSQRHVLFDMEEIARRTGAIINAVMLGAIAGCGRLPIAVEAFEDAIRADGKAVEANLRGFRAGLEAAQASAARRDPESRKRSAATSLADLERVIVSVMSTAARDMIREGARRLVSYQDIAYARLYIDRLAPIRARRRAGGRRRPAPARGRAPSRGAHVLRGRHPGGAGQDRSRPPRPHCGRDGRGARRAAPPHRVPQARHRRILLDPATASWRRRFSRSPNGADGGLSLGHGDQHRRRSRASCASGCWRSCGAAAPQPIATRRSSTRSRTGSA